MTFSISGQGKAMDQFTTTIICILKRCLLQLPVNKLLNFFLLPYNNGSLTVKIRIIMRQFRTHI